MPITFEFETMISLKDFFSLKQNKRFWLHIGGMVLFVIVAIYGALLGLDLYTQHGKSVVVPDIKGMRPLEAKALMMHKELEVQVVDSGYFPSYLPGAVVDQKPKAGARVKAGRMIFVTINSGKVPLRVVPDVIDNSSLREAQAKLSAAGFKLGEVEHVSGEKDWVYGLRYMGRSLVSGEKVPVGATLSLVVGGHVEEAPADSLDVENGDAGDESWF